VPIPELTPDGLLPDGLHECTVDEIAAHFGRFQGSDQRPRLTQQLRDYLAELRSAGVGKYLFVNGSFVTDKPRPSDVDMLLVLRDDVDLTRPVPPFQYNARSRKYIRKYYDFDFFVGFEDDDSSREMMKLFRDVKYRPGEVKGYLKVVL
jgi:hypothetical protein